MNNVCWQLRIFLIALAAIFGTIAQAQTSYLDEMATEAAWITQKAQASCSNPMIDGAIAQSAFPSSGTQIVDAYRGNYAALGLLAAGSQYYPNVKRWATWYMNNVNWPDNLGQYATVYYYDVSANPNPDLCTETPSTTTVNPNWTKPGYDAQDSWAATYLTLMAAWASVDPDATAFINNPTMIYLLDTIADTASSKMLQPSGLTGAKIGYTTQYLMDNSEVVQGLNSYIWIANHVLNDSAKATTWTNVLKPINAAIQSQLWGQCGTNLSCAAYGDPQHSWATCSTEIQSLGTDDEYLWDKGLAGEAQVWPTFAGMMLDNSNNNVSTIFTNLNKYCPSWKTAAELPTPSTAPEYLSIPDSGIGLAAAINLAATKYDYGAATWMNKANTQWMQNHQWPWTVFDAGNAIRTANILNGKSDPAIVCPNSDCTTVANSPQ